MQSKHATKREYSKKILQAFEWLVRYAKSRPVRFVLWSFMSVLISLTIAFTIVFITLILSQAVNSELFFQTWIILGVVFILTNAFIIFRSEYQEYDPWINLRYYSRIRKMTSDEDSKFLLTFHRTGYPREMRFSKIYSQNIIEQAFPFTLTITALALCIFCFSSVFFYFIFTTTIVGIRDIIFLIIVIVVVIFLLYLSLGEGIIGIWNRYRIWRVFWTSYWEYILNKLESMKIGASVADAYGNWYPIVGWSLWETDFDIDDPIILEKIKKRASSLISEHELIDTLPKSHSEIVPYLDNLALYLHVKSLFNENREFLYTISEESTVYENIINVFENLKSLNRPDISTILHQTKDIIELIDVTALSLHAFNELYEISSLDETKKQEVRNLAESQLHYFWNLTGSPLPDSIK